ncbi:MAG TPA: hypothetical protein VNF45_07695 [Candidatus Binataceae bacterium]|nr:hypothetical protein [Candidatus Binataceae bacterium]
MKLLLSNACFSSAERAFEAWRLAAIGGGEPVPANFNGRAFLANIRAGDKIAALQELIWAQDTLETPERANADSIVFAGDTGGDIWSLQKWGIDSILTTTLLRFPKETGEGAEIAILDLTFEVNDDIMTFALADRCTADEESYISKLMPVSDIGNVFQIETEIADLNVRHALSVCHARWRERMEPLLELARETLALADATI